MMSQMAMTLPGHGPLREAAGNAFNCTITAAAAHNTHSSNSNLKLDEKGPAIQNKQHFTQSCACPPPYTLALGYVTRHVGVGSGERQTHTHTPNLPTHSERVGNGNLPTLGILVVEHQNIQDPILFKVSLVFLAN